MGYVNPQVRQITSWQELNQSLYDCMCAWNHSCTFTHTQQLTRPHSSTVGSFHISENPHTCVIMLCSHITLKTPTKPQLSERYTTTTYTIFLQLLPVPSSSSVNNPLCPVCQTHSSVLETLTRDTHVLEKGCETQLRLGCWCEIQPCSLVSQRPKNSCSNTHTHIYTQTSTHMARTLCLELRVPLFTKEQDCFMCVWLYLFQLAWNSRSHSESLYSTLKGGLDLVC